MASILSVHMLLPDTLHPAPYLAQASDGGGRGGSPLIIFLSHIIWSLLLLNCMNLLSILYINRLSDIGFTNIVSHSIDGLFIVSHFVDWFFGYAEAF